MASKKIRKSFVYKYPWVYVWGLKLVHGSIFYKRYRFISNIVGGGQTVLEPGCGPSILPDFLYNKKLYKGFDINKKFIDYAKKRGLNVWVGDVLAEANYSKEDIVVAIDLYHHLGLLERKKLVKLCYENAKKLFIICEPVVSNLENKLTKMQNKINAWLDADGVNVIKPSNFLPQSEFENEIKIGFGVIPNEIERKVEKFNEDIITVFYKK